MSDRDPLTKESWGPGPWQDEPDLVEWWVCGVPCLALRGPGGSWCGYVAVPRGHPYYLRDYDACRLHCHGGLTFSGVRLRGDGWWWLGFDCGHLWDYQPAVAAIVASMMRDWPVELPGRRETYCPLSYVETEIESLARQVARLPIRVMSRRREAKLLSRRRRAARQELVRLAGTPPPRALLGLDWQALSTRSTLRRLSAWPVEPPRVPRSLRGSVGAP